jgi:hypothetical protein
MHVFWLGAPNRGQNWVVTDMVSMMLSNHVCTRTSYDCFLTMQHTNLDSLTLTTTDHCEYCKWILYLYTDDEAHQPTYYQCKRMSQMNERAKERYNLQKELKRQQMCSKSLVEEKNIFPKRRNSVALFDACPSALSSRSKYSVVPDLRSLLVRP